MRFLSCRRDVKFTKRPVTRSCMFLCGVVILAVVLMPHIKCARDASRDTMMSIFLHDVSWISRDVLQ